MRGMGAYIRIKGGKYLGGFVIVEDGQLKETQSIPAPADECESGQLGELFVRTADLIDRWSPDLFALKVSEAQRDPSFTIARRAEGVILGAAGRQRGLPVTNWVRQSLCKPAGLTMKAKTQDAVSALCAGLSQVPADDELRQAAAAAVAALAAA